jgi:hypothetical protein
MMDSQVKDALTSLIEGFSRHADATLKASVLTEVIEVFEQPLPFIKKVEALDACLDVHSEFDAVREYMIDLLFINFFSTEALDLGEDYLDSEEWENIEDQTIDRGTELLNLFLYLKECKEEEEEPELSHFLKEFLLVDDDEFQDEYYIYESMIANQLLVEAAQSEIARVAAGLAEDEELKYLFYPMTSFFANQIFEKKFFDEYLQASYHTSHDAAVLLCIYAFYHGSTLIKN